MLCALELRGLNPVDGLGWHLIITYMALHYHGILFIALYILSHLSKEDENLGSCVARVFLMQGVCLLQLPTFSHSRIY